MSWVMRRAPLFRQTCRHAFEQVSPTATISNTKDGRWIMTFPFKGKGASIVSGFLEKFGMTADLGEDGDPMEPIRIADVCGRFWRKFLFENAPWQEAQAAGVLCAPLRKPHDNINDEHWRQRKTFVDVTHPELGRSFTYVVSKWRSSTSAWRTGRRAPLVNEDEKEIRSASFWPALAPATAKTPAPSATNSALGKPFALQGVRICDFTWFLASAGGTRFLSAFGAQCIKIEWKGNPDLRIAVPAPVGGREARARATAPLPPVDDADMSGQFNQTNPGKLGISLNIRHPEGLAIAKRLVSISDVVAEGFSPGVMDKWGLGYDVLRSLKHDIIYAQQSGMGSEGIYGRFRALGPIAAALSGLSEMSGLPEPAMPAGWGYSYLDWFAAYSLALAILAALYQRNRTGQGQHIDASQTETGIFLAGIPVLDWSANHRPWQRYGNRSPYKLAAPHGTYRCLGTDRWLAIACFTDQEWIALSQVAGRTDWASEPRFRTLQARLANQDDLDAEITRWTIRHDDYELMHKLQSAGVAAGVCQTAEDRCDKDPQLAALEWLKEVTGTKIGTWPVAEVPVKLSETPPYIGGPINRGAPCYGEDNEYVYGELLGLSTAEIGRLVDQGVI
jgi:crotonobetainyl-CoA:carnitine CoA-transferase CaiB-like acyl-CoA transferase